MTRIIIGICTRQRNVLLRRLIDCICTQPVPAACDVLVLVVDNNDAPMVQPVLKDMATDFPIDVVHEPKVGLVHARNRALVEASARKADWFIGVDDDEWVAEDWLAQFIRGFQTLDRPILLGPCEYVHGAGLSPYLGPMRFPVRKAGQRPSVYATNNFALRRDVFDPEHGPALRFNPRFNESGAEDTEFLLRAQRLHGWTPASWPDAVVYESWDGPRNTLYHRMRREWRVRRTWHGIAWLHTRMGLRRGHWPVVRQALGQIGRAHV